MDSKARTFVFLLILGLSQARTITDYSVENDILSNGLVTEDITSTILRMNKESTEFLKEGDILIPKTRNAIKCASKEYDCLWPKSANGKVEIPFIISNSYESSEVDEILNAMKDFKSKTCVQFIPRKSQTSYLSIEPKNGCSSTVGRLGDKQVLSLQRFGCVSKGVIQHEMLHTLGFYHEHTRSDRDTYVRINWENIRDGLSYNFQKMDTNNLNTKYDYSSIMHYAGNAFSKTPGGNTITPIPDASVPIGQTTAMSKIDIQRVNKLYNCCK